MIAFRALRRSGALAGVQGLACAAVDAWTPSRERPILESYVGTGPGCRGPTSLIRTFPSLASSASPVDRHATGPDRLGHALQDQRQVGPELQHAPPRDRRRCPLASDAVVVDRPDRHVAAQEGG